MSDIGELGTALISKEEGFSVTAVLAAVKGYFQELARVRSLKALTQLNEAYTGSQTMYVDRFCWGAAVGYLMGHVVKRALIVAGASILAIQLLHEWGYIDIRYNKNFGQEGDDIEDGSRFERSSSLAASARRRVQAIANSGIPSLTAIGLGVFCGMVIF